MLVYEHLKFDIAAPVLRSFVEKNLKIILLIRNPLDAFVSAAFYNHWKEGAKTNINFEQVIRNRAEIFKGNLNNQAASWIQFPGIHVVRYENLVEETEKSLNQIAVHLKIDSAKQRVNDAVNKFRFEIMTGGRQRGEVCENNHLRKGIIEDYKNHLNYKQINFLQNLWQKELKTLKY